MTKCPYCGAPPQPNQEEDIDAIAYTCSEAGYDHTWSEPK